MVKLWKHLTGNLSSSIGWRPLSGPAEIQRRPRRDEAIFKIQIRSANTMLRAQPTVLHIGNTSSYNSVKCIYLDYSKQRCLCYISIFIKEMCCFFFWVFLPPNAQKSLTAAAVKSILFHCSSTESCLMLDWGSFHPWVHAMGIWSKVRLSFSGLSVAGGVSHLYGDFFLSRLKMCTRHQHCPHLSGCVFRRFF